MRSREDLDILPIDTSNPGPQHFGGSLFAGKMGRQTFSAVTAVLQFSWRIDASEKAPIAHD
jgi:hypothetical protein